jgi:hypothetical protein
LPSALDPDLMTPAERLAEIGEILAAGILGLRAKQCQTGDLRDIPPRLRRPPEPSWPEPTKQRKAMNDNMLAQLAALPEKIPIEMKQLWRQLYDRAPPSGNKPFLVKRLSYRIQELAYGGLSARAEAKLAVLIEEEGRRASGLRVVRKGDRPIAGTRLIRALAPSIRWKRLLEEGRCRSIGEIAEAEKIDRSFVSRLLRLTVLAPDIQEAILGWINRCRRLAKDFKNFTRNARSVQNRRHPLHAAKPMQLLIRFPERY